METLRVKSNFPWELSHGLLLPLSLTNSFPRPLQKENQVLTQSRLAKGHLLSPAGASDTGFAEGVGETQSEERVRLKGRGFVWSLCYLKALKLYNAKQVPFFFIYGSYIPSFITAIHFSNLTADKTENSLLGKNSIYHSLQDNNFRIKGEKYIYIYMQKYPYLFLAPELHTEYGFGSRITLDQSSGGFF